MKHIYSPFLAIFLIFVIIGFSIYKQLDVKKEGLENMDPEESDIVITRNKRKIIRRKKSIKVNKAMSQVYRENFNIGSFIKDKIGGPITRGFTKIGNFFKALGSYIKCSFAKVKNLPNCMPWYMLQVFGKCLYLPVIFFVWLLKLQKIERDTWDILESIDRFVFEQFGFHIIHYPESIVNRCYKCSSLVPFPK
jgi:hypothetical protein